MLGSCRGHVGPRTGDGLPREGASRFSHPRCRATPGGAHTVGCGKRWKEAQCPPRGQGEDTPGQTEGICHAPAERDWSSPLPLRGHHTVPQREASRCCPIFLPTPHDKEGAKKEAGHRKGGFWEKSWSKGAP